MELRGLSGRRRPHERTAAVVDVSLDRPLEPVEVDPDRYDEVLLVARVGHAVVGQAFVPARARLTPAEVWGHLERALGPELRRAALRALIRRALAPPEPNAEATAAAVSVVVCTRERPADLRRCLASLGELEAPAEVVVVDNGPPGGETERIATEFSVRYVHEPSPGQARARNAGINAASGELIAFTDDDCVVDPHWLDALAIDFADPAVGLVTGCIAPFELETPAQYLFEAHGGFERTGKRRLWDPTEVSPAEITGQVGAGANMIFRRRVLEEIGGFSEDLGPGTPARSGDDKDAFYRLLVAGHRILYTPERVVRHRHRESPQALRRVLSDYGISEFSYALRNLVRRRDPGAVRVFKWWLRHFAREAWSHLTRHPERLPLRLLAAEVGGTLRAPFALSRSRRSRRSLPPIAVEPTRPAAETSAVEVVGEDPGAITMAIATRDRRERLRGLLAALGRQTLPRDRYEVVVVVDGATDGSAEMARGLELPFEIRVVEQEPSGLAVARNRGAREARHPIVVFFDDDIVPAEGLLAAHLEAHHGGGGPRAVLGPYPPAELPSDQWGRRQAAWWRDHFRRKAEPGHLWSFIDYVDGNTSLEPRALEALGGYDERFRGGRRQDWELGVRMLEAGWDFVHCEAADGAHHFDSRLETAFRIGREEGRLDVMLVRLHPHVRDHLPLPWMASQLLGRRRTKELVHARLFGGLRPWRPYLGLLERADLLRPWNTIANRVLTRAYLAGVADAIPDDDERRAFLDWARGPDERPAAPVVELSEPGGFDRDSPIAPVELELRWRGWPLGRHRVLPASENWAWDEVVERLTLAVERSTALTFPPEWLAQAADPAVAP